jgi:hypothetical protein
LALISVHGIYGWFKTTGREFILRAFHLGYSVGALARKAGRAREGAFSVVAPKNHSFASQHTGQAPLVQSERFLSKIEQPILFNPFLSDRPHLHQEEK